MLLATRSNTPEFFEFFIYGLVVNQSNQLLKNDYSNRPRVVDYY